MKTLAKIIFILTIISSSLTMVAQNYQNAFGLRGGWYDGFTFRHMLSDSKAIEVLLTSRWRGVDVTGLYEIQAPLKEEGFDWYYGAGAHVGDYNSHYYYNYGNPHYYDNNYSRAFGFDAIGGLEYTFKDIPLNLSADIHPLIDFSQRDTWFWYDGALSARFTFN